MAMTSKRFDDQDGLVGPTDDALEQLTHDLRDLMEMSQAIEELVTTQQLSFDVAHQRISQVDDVILETVEVQQQTPHAKRNYLLTGGVALGGATLALTAGIMLGPVSALITTTLTVAGCAVTRIVPGISQ